LRVSTPQSSRSSSFVAITASLSRHRIAKDRRGGGLCPPALTAARRGADPAKVAMAREARRTFAG
jgi:hypothetical protein